MHFKLLAVTVILFIVQPSLVHYYWELWLSFGTYIEINYVSYNLVKFVPFFSRKIKQHFYWINLFNLFCNDAQHTSEYQSIQTRLWNNITMMNQLNAYYLLDNKWTHGKTVLSFCFLPFRYFEWIPRFLKK